MPFSYAQYAGDGVATTFSVPFPYLLKAHVKVYIGFNIVDGTFSSELVEGTDFDWTSGTQIQTTVAPAIGQTLTTVRQTPSTNLIVQWQDGSNLIAEDLIDSDLQNLYVVQEQQDRNDAAITQLGSSAAAAQAAAASAVTAQSEATAAIAAANAATAAANAVTTTSNAASAAANAAVQIATAAAVPQSPIQVLEPLAILLGASISIGVPGRIPFGVGPALPAGSVISGISQRDYYPIHLASGSFI